MRKTGLFCLLPTEAYAIKLRLSVDCFAIASVPWDKRKEENAHEANGDGGVVQHGGGGQQ
jgi:hypothetical protein